MTQETQKPKKTKNELVRAMQREFNEISSIMEGITELKEEAKAQGFDAALLAKIAKAMSESKTDDIIDKNDEFARTVDEVRNSA